MNARKAHDIWIEQCKAAQTIKTRFGVTAALKNRIEAVLSAKVIEQRRMLQTGLSKLTRFQGGARSKAAFGWGARGKVAAKYRNPDNPAETWAGRGLKPRWLAAAIKSGKKMDDFLIAAAPSSKANGRKKARKPRK
jgi:DNA-binding protein H-NS